MAQGHSLREISRLLKLARNTVRAILRQPPPEAQGEPSVAPPPDARSGGRDPFHHRKLKMNIYH
jgi:hypothetical protein